MTITDRIATWPRERRVPWRVSRPAWRLDQTERERIRAAAAGLSPARGAPHRDAGNNGARDCPRSYGTRFRLTSDRIPDLTRREKVLSTAPVVILLTPLAAHRDDREVRASAAAPRARRRRSNMAA